MVAQSEIGIGGEADGTEHCGDRCGEHCPFLNRSDRRCSDCLSLDRLDHAFDYCFGEYKACPVYLEQLAERRVRRLCGQVAPPLTPPAAGPTDAARHDRDRRPLSLVQLKVSAPPVGSLPHRYPRRAA